MTVHASAEPVAAKAVSAELPVALTPYAIEHRRAGLIIVDEINGFATVGAGPLAPPAPNAQVSRMVAETNALACGFLGQGRPVCAFIDSHVPGRPEPPYPAHCERGSGEDELVPELKWLEAEAGVTLLRKDCINGFVGAIDPNTGRNWLVQWINDNRLETIVVVGICTDICVMDFVLSMLSARNHDLMPSLGDVVVYEPGCATYQMSKEDAASLGLPETAAHPQDLTHHLALYFMASRGAVLASSIA